MAIKSMANGFLYCGIVLSISTTGCDWRAFDDLKSEAWVVGTSVPSDFTSVDINAALVPGASDAEVGLRAYAIGKAQPQVFQLRFDDAGALLSDTSDIASTGGAAIPDRAATASDGTNVALGISTNATARVVWWNANSLSLSTIALDGGTTTPSGVAINDDTGSACIGNQLWSFSLVGTTTATDPCSLGMAVGGLALAALGTSVVVGEGTSLSLRNPSDCSVLKTVTTSGVSDLGTTLAVGDLDGDGTQDVVAGAPAQNIVYVYFNFASGNMEPEAISGPSGARNFGHSLAIGDIDGDGSDELVVGDPTATAEGEANAGRAHIYVSGDFDNPVTIYDSSPENGQLFGSAVTIAPFGTTNLGRLVVAAEKELFTYFRHPISGDEDVRN